MRMIKYDRTPCRADASRIHRGSSGRYLGFVCNACGTEVVESSVAPLTLDVWPKRVDICAACVGPWFALIATLKIPPESEGFDATDWTKPPLPRAPDWCSGCEYDAERKARGVIEARRQDRGWLTELLQKVGIK